MNMTSDLVEVRDLWFRYPRGDWVLRGVELSVKRGEHILIIGDTGSGKTTLLRALTGLGVIVYSGEIKGYIRILGRDISEYSTSDLFKILGVVGQNPYHYFTDLHVYRDLYNYALRVYRDHYKAERAVNKVIEALTLHSLLDKYFFELSGGEAKRVIAAKTLISDPLILLLDEPLMWLDEQDVNDVVEIIRVLRRLGKSIIVFEHRFTPIIDYFDRVLVIKEGKLFEVTLSLKSILSRRGRKIVEERSVFNTISQGNSVVLKATNITHYYGSKLILRDVNIELKTSDKVLIYGSNGSGKTTLLKILAGYLKPTKGRVERRGDVVYIPQNIVLFYTEETVRREIEEICKSRRRGNECVNDGLRIVSNMGIDHNTSPFNLSHGQMVKLAVTLAVISGANILLIDEPFSGLTYRDRFKLIKDLIKLDKVVVLASSWLEPASLPGWSSVFKIEDHVLTLLGTVKYSYTLEELADICSKLIGGDIA